MPLNVVKSRTKKIHSHSLGYIKGKGGKFAHGINVVEIVVGLVDCVIF